MKKEAMIALILGTTLTGAVSADSAKSSKANSNKSTQKCEPMKCGAGKCGSMKNCDDKVTSTDAKNSNSAKDTHKKNKSGGK